LGIKKDNREALAFIGGGLAAAITGAWAVYLRFSKKPKEPSTDLTMPRASTPRPRRSVPEHPHVSQSLENYAALLRKLDRTAEAEAMEARTKAIRAGH
jgi:hypothetical protein